MSFSTDAVLDLNNVGSVEEVLVDGVKPEPVLTSEVGSLTNAAFSVTFEYDETVSGFELGDIQVTNGTASNFAAIVSGQKWSADITPTNDGDVSVTLPAGIATDAPGNASVAGNTINTSFDGTGPEVVSINRNDTDPVVTGTSEVNFRVIFSEEVKGEGLEDLEVALTGTATGVLKTAVEIDNRTFDVTIEGVSGQGTIGLNLKDDDSITDLAGNLLGGIGVGNGDFTGQVYTTNFIPTDISITSNAIDENNGVGDVVGELSTTDADGTDTRSYSLVSGVGDTDNASFTIDGVELKAAESFDFEVKNSYEIRVKTDDGKGGEFEKALVISITNVLEPAIELSGGPNL